VKQCKKLCLTEKITPHRIRAYACYAETSCEGGAGR